jgi:hypothetical protein
MGSPWTPEKQEKVRRSNELRRIVDAYLLALEDDQAQDQRRETLSVEQLEQRLHRARSDAATMSGVKKLKKLQEAQNWQQRLDDAVAPGSSVDLKSLEKAFIEVAAEYSANQGITPPVWREVGVSPRVLRAAGLTAPAVRSRS